MHLYMVMMTINTDGGDQHGFDFTVAYSDEELENEVNRIVGNMQQEYPDHADKIKYRTMKIQKVNGHIIQPLPKQQKDSTP